MGSGLNTKIIIAAFFGVTFLIVLTFASILYAINYVCDKPLVGIAVNFFSGGMCDYAAGGGGGDAGVRENSCSTALYPNITDEAAYAKAIDDYIPDSSPLNGMGKHFVAGGKAAGVNPAYIVTVAQKESSFGKHIPPGTNNSFGRTATSSQPHVSFKGRKWYKWSSFQASLDSSEDTEAKYIKRMYIDKGKTSIQEVVYTYAPPSENNSDLYVKQIIQWINEINGKAGGAITCS